MIPQASKSQYQPNLVEEALEIFGANMGLN